MQEDLQASTRPCPQMPASSLSGEGSGRKPVSNRRPSSRPNCSTTPDALNREFSQVANTVSKPLSRLLDLNREASTLQEKVDKHLSAIRDQINVIDRKLWNFDAET